jgi:adenylosuccinate synthase
MTGTAVLGAQWGDEGKGKITDMLASESDVVARFSGGDNAGHTVVVGAETFKLHLTPSGILYPGVLCVLGSGMVISPRSLINELKGLSEKGVDVSARRLRIDGKAHLVLPYHIALDGASETQLGGSAIGTTCRGIGPSYADKASRRGLRALDMLDETVFADRLRAEAQAKNIRLEKVYGVEPLDINEMVQEHVKFAAQLAPYIDDVSLLLDDAYQQGNNIFYEGAQGVLLDIDHGTYPYVTSSSPATGGILAGLGIGANRIDRVIGVVKAYQTRVGAGPMSTELKDEVGDGLVERGAEFGTTTGRRRRCGWLDLVALRYTVRLCGMTELAVTKLDILTSLNPIKVCVAYEHKGQRLEHFPADTRILAECEPIYETMPGWKEDFQSVREDSGLPKTAIAYVRTIEDATGVPVRIISVGPERDQTIHRDG